MSTDGKKEVNNLNEAFANMTPDPVSYTHLKQDSSPFINLPGYIIF